MSFLQWAYNKDDPKDKKYSTTIHATYITVSGTLLFLGIFLAIRYSCFGL